MKSMFPIINVPENINPFIILIVCFTLNILSLFICYRMVSNHEEYTSKFIFDHNNELDKYHPWLKKYQIRIDELENKVDIMLSDRKTNYF